MDRHCGPYIVTSARHPPHFLSGVEWSPAFSPDGRSVAFAWDPEIRRKLDIYVKRIGAEPPRHLTTQPESEAWPAWSPDGRWIAYVADDPPSCCRIRVVSSGGGLARDITRIHDLGRHLSAPYIAWLPDGSKIIVPDRERDESGFALFLLDPASGSRARLTTPPDGTLGDSGAVLSPDRRSIAFVRSQDTSISSILVMPLPPASRGLPPERLVTIAHSNIAHLMWTAAGDEILYLTPDPNRLWRVRADGRSRPQDVGAIGMLGTHWTAAPGGTRLAYVDLLTDVDIWRIQANTRTGPERQCGDLALCGGRLQSASIDLARWARARQSALVAGREIRGF